MIHFLEKQGIPFIHTDSLSHTKRLYFIHGESSFPLYIVDESTGSAVSLRGKNEDV